MATSMKPEDSRQVTHKNHIEQHLDVKSISKIEKRSSQMEEDSRQMAHKNHIEHLLDVKPISKVEKRSSQYHKAIIRGRHPRSFKRKDMQTASLWKFISTSSERVKFCHAGQRVNEVASQEVDLPQEADIGKDGKAEETSKSPSKSTAVALSENPKVQKRLIKMRREQQDALKKPIYRSKQDRELLRERSKIQRRMNMEIRLFRKYACRTLYKESDPNHPDANANSHITANKITEADFNTMKDTKIFYRSTVAFELVSDGTWLTVDHRQNQHVCARALDLGGQYVFRIINLKYPKDVSPIRYGDEIWLLVVPGSRSHDGLVLSTSCKHAINLIEQQRKTKSNSQTLGKLNVCPARTYTEQGTHDLSVQTNKYNQRALAAGKLRIRKFSPNENQLANEKKECTNLAEISLEQDFYHVAVNEQKRDVVLRKFFSSNGNSNARSDVNVDSGVSSGGVWRLHLIEDATTDDGLGSLEIYQTRQRLLYNARVQLQESAQLRDGETKRADKMKERDSLTTGTKFVPSIRAARQRAELEAEHSVILSGTQQMTKLKDGIRNPQPETTEHPLAKKRQSKNKKRDKVPPLRNLGKRSVAASKHSGIGRSTSAKTLRRRSSRGKESRASRSGMSWSQDILEEKAVFRDALATAAVEVTNARRRRLSKSPEAARSSRSRLRSSSNSGRSRRHDLSKSGDLISGEAQQMSVPVRRRRVSFQKLGITLREYKRRVNRRQQRLTIKMSRKERMAKYEKWLAKQDEAEMSPFQKCHHQLNKCTQEITKKLSEESELKLPKSFLHGSQEKKKPPAKADDSWMQKLLSQDEKVVGFVAAMQKEHEEKEEPFKKKHQSSDLEEFPYH